MTKEVWPSDYEVGFHDGALAERKRIAEAWLRVDEESFAAARLTRDERRRREVEAMTWAPGELSEWLADVAERHTVRDEAALRSAASSVVAA